MLHEQSVIGRHNANPDIVVAEIAL